LVALLRENQLIGFVYPQNQLIGFVVARRNICLRAYKFALGVNILVSISVGV
jgi:hypothetical protein